MAESAEKVIRTVRLTNAHGLHLRPAKALSDSAQRFPCDIRVLCDGREADAKSILSLMALGADAGTELILEAHGLQAQEALECLANLVSEKFCFADEEGACLMNSTLIQPNGNSAVDLLPPVRTFDNTNGATTIHDLIARRAYAIWKSRGCPSGTALQDWLRAEADIKAAIRRARRRHPGDRQ